MPNSSNDHTYHSRMRRCYGSPRSPSYSSVTLRTQSRSVRTPSRSPTLSRSRSRSRSSWGHEDESSASFRSARTDPAYREFLRMRSAGYDPYSGSRAFYHNPSAYVGDAQYPYIQYEAPTMRRFHPERLMIGSVAQPPWPPPIAPQPRLRNQPPSQLPPLPPRVNHSSGPSGAQQGDGSAVKAVIDAATQKFEKEEMISDVEFSDVINGILRKKLCSEKSWKELELETQEEFDKKMKQLWLPKGAAIGPIPRTNKWLLNKLQFRSAKDRDSNFQTGQKNMMYAVTGFARIFDKTTDPELQAICVDSLVALGRSFMMFHKMRLENLEAFLSQPWAKLPGVMEPAQWGKHLYPDEKEQIVIKNLIEAVETKEKTKKLKQEMAKRSRKSQRGGTSHRGSCGQGRQAATNPRDSYDRYDRPNYQESSRPSEGVFQPKTRRGQSKELYQGGQHKKGRKSNQGPY